MEAPDSALDIVERFGDQARTQPGALALYCAGESVTYHQLDRWSSAIARDLAAAGVVPGDGVAVLAPRGAALHAGLLGVLKAGAWYLAIDPGHAVQRRNMLLRRAQCAAVLTEPADANPELPTELVLSSLARREAEPWSAPHIPGLPAYVCFTSGTTAEPKPVMVSRGSLSAFVDAFIGRVGIKSQWSLAGFCPPDWDGFAIDTWIPLAAGAAAETGSATDRANPGAIAKFIADRAVQAAFLPTAIGQIVMASSHLTSARELRHLCLGGDRLTRRPGPDAGYTLWNVYGPTETTVAAIVSPVAPDDLPDIPLGWPLPGSQLDIVGTEHIPCPPGEPGEILIAGVGVAIGYLGEPRATAAAFVPGPAGRHYRTGDLGQSLPDGQFHFIGRRDRQVSVHGRRIELDGVAAALHAITGVVDACAAVAGTGEEQTLVALVVSAHGSGLTPDSVRADLENWLGPQQMPDRIVMLPAIPAPAQLEDTITGIITGPLSDDDPEDFEMDEVTECVADAWATQFGGPRPGLDDNFFGQGGNSLMAVELVQRLQEAFAVEVRLMAFLDSPTPRSLADLLRAEVGQQFDDLPKQERARLLEERAW